ncbi:MAG: hypothetical protein J6S49_08955, partial [Erysipelotrichaceae bacterium]|nr:hypothetical protein [Erysipelotrichaceae bacterium]
SDFFQRSGENRIWYRTGRLINGYTVGVTDQDYDVTPYYTGYVANNWAKSFVIDDSDTYLGIAIRKSDKSNISSLTQAQLTALVDYGAESVLVSKVDKLLATKFVHVSFDDCVFWTDLIDNEDNYTSCFENSFLGYLQDLHETYGATFTLNCFCTSDTYSIENVPSKFATEFSENKDWLRFAFHAEDSTSDYSMDAVDDIKASYNKFTAAIYTMTGDIGCIDRVTRLGYFSGTLNNVKGIRDVPCGVVGLLTSDDTRTSYYLGSADNTYILNHAKMFDATNHIMFIHTQKRLESTTLANMETWLNDFLTVSNGNFSNYLELFTHEYEWNSTMLSKMETCFQWLNNNGYSFVFMQDLLKL